MKNKDNRGWQWERHLHDPKPATDQQPEYMNRKRKAGKGGSTHVQKGKLRNVTAHEEVPQIINDHNKDQMKTRKLHLQSKRKSRCPMRPSHVWTLRRKPQAATSNRKVLWPTQLLCMAVGGLVHMVTWILHPKTPGLWSLHFWATPQAKGLPLGSSNKS